MYLNIPNIINMAIGRQKSIYMINELKSDMASDLTYS